jgi:hypothetical protein
MKMWTDLTEEQEISYRKWARENYTPLMLIYGTWHYVCQDECVKMNREFNEE